MSNLCSLCNNVQLHFHRCDQVQAPSLMSFSPRVDETGHRPLLCITLQLSVFLDSPFIRAL